jgi:hypothetical protein
MNIIFLFSSLNSILLFSLVLCLQKLFSTTIEITKTDDCEYFKNFTAIHNTTSYYVQCQNILIENQRIKGITLTVYIVLVLINIVYLIRIYKMYKRKLFIFKIKCVYTREEPEEILLSRCESVPC